MTKELFQMALNVTDPWFVSDLTFDEKAKKLDIYIDFKKGSTFSYIDPKSKEEFARLKVHDTKDKRWRHLNFFEHECYLQCRERSEEMPLGCQSTKSKTT